jgi:hypothetical protein
MGMKLGLRQLGKDVFQNRLLTETIWSQKELHDNTARIYWLKPRNEDLDNL